MIDKPFEKLVSDHSRLVLDVALRIVGHGDIANDIHQEVFLSIWQRWSHCQDVKNWPAYLYRVTVRKAIDTIRSRKQETHVENLEHIPDHKARPGAALAVTELQERIRACLTQLTEKQAQVLVLSRIEGLDYATIAQTLSCSQETVRVHLHRGLKRLTELMRPYLEEKSL